MKRATNQPGAGPAGLAAGVSSKRREALEGPERLCSHCKEWWPEDIEFFNRHSADGWQSWCKACTNERRTAKRQAAKQEVAHAACGGP